MLLFKNAQICSEEAVSAPQDILIKDGQVSSIGENLEAPEGARVVDASGKLLMPTMFDTHVHFREPGQTHKEDIASGGAAALNGGVTGIVMMPNTSPSIDNPAIVKDLLEKAKQVTKINVYTSGCVSKGREGKELAAIHGMKEAGVLMLTDDGDTVDDPALYKRAMEYATEFGMFFASHCETPSLSGPRAMNEGKKSFELGVIGSPAISEEICMDRDIRLAYATGAHLHIQHVSSGIGVKTIKFWKEMGARVTAEVCPHHLIFNEEDIGEYDTNFKMNPPLRTAEDNEMLLEGLKEGVFDIISTDHAPHTEYEKTSVDFVSAPNGITGLETALISLYHEYVQHGKLDWPLIVNKFSAEPRRMMQIAPVPIVEGGAAEFLLFDPNATTTFSRDFFASKSINSPYIDKTLNGEIQMVVMGDEVLLERNV